MEKGLEMGIRKLRKQTPGFDEDTTHAVEVAAYQKWSQLMWEAYRQKGMLGILALSADIVQHHDAIAAAAEDELRDWTHQHRSVIAARLVIGLYEPALKKIYALQDGSWAGERDQGMALDEALSARESSSSSDALNAHVDRLEAFDDRLRKQSGNTSTGNIRLHVLRKRVLH